MRYWRRSWLRGFTSGSVAVKFDLYNNAGEGPNSTGLYINGAQPTMPAVDLTPSGVNLHSGDTMEANIVYNGTTLAMTLTDTVTKASFSNSWAINIPSTVGGDTAYVGFTGGTGGLTAIQKVLSWTYTAASGSSPALSAPAFSLAAGTYTSAQTVSISDATSGATIYYTTNGTTPTASSTKYTGAITVPSTETLEAIAVETGYTNSPVATAAYTIDPVAATPSFSVAAGTYSSAQTVTISDATSGATIYYTTDGTTPTTSSTKYSGAITVASTQTLKAIAVASGYTNSAVATAAYTITSTLPTPTFSVAAGTYTSAQTVSISDATSGATIYYTTNGTTPTTSSTKYTGAITVSSTMTLQAVAVLTGYTNSPVGVAAYTITTPSSSPGTQTIIDCPSGFSSSGSCGLGILEGGQSFQLNGTTSGSSPALSGSRALLIPTGATHAALSLNYQKQVNVQAFTASFTFIPNGQNVAFVLNNTTNNPWGFNGALFSAGAGCEGGFFQGYDPPTPNNLFALELDSYSPLTQSGSFTNSSVQIYQAAQSPCLPTIEDYPAITKISTAPLDLTTGSQNTTTGHTYSATVAYDGSNLTLNLYDVTAGGSCPGTNCFTHTWTGVNIPSAVGGDAAWVGLTGATGLTSSYPLYVGSFVYTTP